jgi:hypothetical protein
VNAHQIVRQLQTILRAATWPGGAVVFHAQSVRISRALGDGVVDEIIWPAALIAPGAFQADPEQDEHHRLVRRDIVVRLVAASAHDRYGEAALVGGADVAGAEGSGAGLLLLEEKLLDAVAELGPVSGVHLAVALGSGVAVEFDGRAHYLASCEYVLTGEMTLTRTFTQPGNFSAVRTGGNVALSWAQPPSRFDRLGVKLRRSSGSTAPATVTDGTEVVVALGATSVADAPGLGTHSYSIFGVYDDDGDGNADSYSNPRSVTV